MGGTVAGGVTHHLRVTIVEACREGLFDRDPLNALRIGPPDMKIHRKIACILALVSMTSPALADVRTAAFTGAADRQSPQASTFVGATVRFSLNRKYDEPRHRAAIGISRMAYSPQTSEIRVGQGLELAFSGKQKPALSLAGMDLPQLRRTANLSGGGKTALIVVGVAAALGVAALVALDTVRCDAKEEECE